MSWLSIYAAFLRNNCFRQIRKVLRRHCSLYLQENFVCGEMTKVFKVQNWQIILDHYGGNVVLRIETGQLLVSSIKTTD